MGHFCAQNRPLIHIIHYHSSLMNEICQKNVKPFTDSPLSKAILFKALKFWLSFHFVSFIEIGQEQAPFVVLVYFFPHLNMQKIDDYGPQQH
jgi:hypothetical protein